MNTFTKDYIKEELYIQATKLTCPNAYKLNDNDYINKVLGIKVSINESVSFETQKLILQEHLILENLLDSIKNFVGTEYNKIVNGVKNFKDFAILIKDLIENPKYLSNAISRIKDVAVKIFTEINNVVKGAVNKATDSFPEIGQKINNFLTQVQTTINNLSAGDGWKNFVELIGFATLLKWVQKSIVDKIKSKVVNFFQDNIFDTFKTIFDSFKNLVKTIVSELGITEIIKWFTSFNSGFGAIKAPINIINLLGEVMAPVISLVGLLKKLKKSTDMNEYYMSQTKKLISEIKSDSYMIKAVQKAANTNDQLFEYYMKIITEPTLRKDNENLFGEKVINMASKIFEKEEIKTVDSIAQKFNVDKSEIEKQLEIGIKAEKEHTDSNDVAKKIALDHLNEIPDYYSRLTKMEKEAKKTTKKTTKKKSKDEQV